jgi:transcriptional regulator of arginine metabolism
MKPERRRDLLKILHDGSASSQSEIVRALRELGHDVTQATVSRDLGDLGAARVRTGGRTVYRMPDDLPGNGGEGTPQALRRSLDDFAIDISVAASLVVVKTAPGLAAAVGRAIDLAGVIEVVGTVAGDDTIFVATGSNETAEALAAGWRTRSPNGRR